MEIRETYKNRKTEIKSKLSEYEFGIFRKLLADSE